MKHILRILPFVLLTFSCSALNAKDFEKDIIKTSDGDLEITFIAHGTLMVFFNDLTIHVDPVAGYTDYNKLPKADIIMITHQHGDHMNKDAIEILKDKGTEIVLTETCFNSLNEGIVLKNGEKKVIKGIKVEAVPAYNLVHKRDGGDPFHPKGIGNGYVMDFSNTRVYIGGDTENFPEMKDIKNIDIAFLPMNLPYTMTPQMVADAVNVLNPKILYPYHFGSTDTDVLLKLLSDHKSTEIRIRNMK